MAVIGHGAREPRSRPIAIRTHVRYARSMGDAGSAHARFRRALLTGNLALIDASARELPQISLTDALRILVVMAQKRDERFARAGARWAGRVIAERRLSLDESHRLLALVAALPVAPDSIAVLLRGYCD
jgi:hypothetical protein